MNVAFWVWLTWFRWLFLRPETPAGAEQIIQRCEADRISLFIPPLK